MKTHRTLSFVIKNGLVLGLLGLSLLIGAKESSASGGGLTCDENFANHFCAFYPRPSGGSTVPGSDNGHYVCTVGGTKGCLQ